MTLRIEPSSCWYAKTKNIKVIEEFFDIRLAKDLKKKINADLIIANNVLAHVPDINNFLKGISIILKNSGIATFEFPHLLELIKHNHDTIYHEHFSYLSILALENIFKK